MHEFLKGDSLRVFVKTNANETRILGFDTTNNALRIAIAAPAQNNKANLALLKFIAKQTGKKVIIASGRSSRLKLLRMS